MYAAHCSTTTVLNGEKQILVTCHPRLKGKKKKSPVTPPRADVHYWKYLPSHFGSFKEEPVVTRVFYWELVQNPAKNLRMCWILCAWVASVKTRVSAITKITARPIKLSQPWSQRQENPCFAELRFSQESWIIFLTLSLTLLVLAFSRRFPEPSNGWLRLSSTSR